MLINWCKKEREKNDNHLEIWEIVLILWINCGFFVVVDCWFYWGNRQFLAWAKIRKRKTFGVFDVI